MKEREKEKQTPVPWELKDPKPPVVQSRSSEQISESRLRFVSGSSSA